MNSQRAVPRSAIVDAARGYLGVRWHHQGRTRAGLDCIGLVIRVAHDLGLTDYDFTAYDRRPSGDTLRTQMAQQLRLLRGGEPHRAGDVLLFSFAATPMHTAIATGNGMVHAFANMRRVVEHRVDDLWRSRLVAAYAFPGVEDD